MAGRFGRFYDSSDKGSEYVYGPTDTGKGGGSTNTGSKGQPSSTPKEKPRESRPDKKDKAHDKDVHDRMRADDAFMNEPSDVRGVESGAYDGVEGPGDRAREDV